MHSIACQWRQQVKINNIRIRANEVKSQYKILKLTQIPDTRNSRQAGFCHMMTKSINAKKKNINVKEEHLTTVKHILQDAKMLFIGLHDNGGRQF